MGNRMELWWLVEKGKRRGKGKARDRWKGDERESGRKSRKKRKRLGMGWWRRT